MERVMDDGEIESDQYGRREKIHQKQIDRLRFNCPLGRKWNINVL